MAYTNPAGQISLTTPVELRRIDRTEDFTIHVTSNEEAERLKSILTDGIQQRKDFVDEKHSVRFCSFLLRTSMSFTIIVIVFLNKACRG